MGKAGVDERGGGAAESRWGGGKGGDREAEESCRYEIVSMPGKVGCDNTEKDADESLKGVD